MFSQRSWSRWDKDGWSGRPSEAALLPRTQERWGKTVNGVGSGMNPVAPLTSSLTFPEVSARLAEDECCLFEPLKKKRKQKSRREAEGFAL